jgi:hypothetical protein
MLAKYPILRIIGGLPTPSTINQDTRAAVLARIHELEAPPRVLTPVSNLAIAGPSSNADLQARRPRAILALEATLRETRRAGRALQAARMARHAGPARYPLAGAAGGAGDGGRSSGGDQNDRSTRFRAENGWRLPRIRVLTHQELWRGGLGPPDQQATLPHQKCTICHFAKSHPVS